MRLGKVYTRPRRFVLHVVTGGISGAVCLVLFACLVALVDTREDWRL